MVPPAVALLQTLGVHGGVCRGSRGGEDGPSLLFLSAKPVVVGSEACDRAFGSKSSLVLRWTGLTAVGAGSFGGIGSRGRFGAGASWLAGLSERLMGGASGREVHPDSSPSRHAPLLVTCRPPRRPLQLHEETEDEYEEPLPLANLPNQPMKFLWVHLSLGLHTP
ncbi:basic helix-loop-helix (bHLH) DNA-bindingsuperfamily protein [Striga asiatica]|uniref:Basic helix-loop-helix (BHLH) DNA-bindingsuperfamily protein n=1 Tax=Striga asiatica TaxID=4170 RepID=A0A5A7P2N1_STRAF|nr:basic helix-loop-helix (bHLH) DNA-bindingsuperfamily protein [Striga asiatica]